jgi:hypothetical protein
MARIYNDLEHGMGIALVRGIPVQRYDRSQLDILYAGIASHLGHTRSQSREGELIGVVTDTGKRLGDKGSRGTKTKDPIPFHTDRTDIVGLFCLKNMHIDSIFCDDDLPTEDQAKEYTFAFLERAAPDLASRAEVRWIKPLRRNPVDPPHDTAFPFYNAQQRTECVVLGMRVKLFDPETNGFGWVISAKGGRVLAFERDIGWNRRRLCRTTEQWLHDPWVMRCARVG